MDFRGREQYAGQELNTLHKLRRDPRERTRREKEWEDGAGWLEFNFISQREFLSELRVCGDWTRLGSALRFEETPRCLATKNTRDDAGRKVNDGRGTSHVEKKAAEKGGRKSITPVMKERRTDIDCEGETRGRFVSAKLDEQRK